VLRASYFARQLSSREPDDCAMISAIRLIGAGLTGAGRHGAGNEESRCLSSFAAGVLTLIIVSRS
jgi:hypothetical protein